MKIKLLLFARIKDLANKPFLEMEVSPNCSVQDLRARLDSEFPWLESWLRCSSFAINGAFVGSTDRIQEGDEVALIPPVSGGSKSLEVCLTSEDIDPGRLLQNLGGGVDGAVVLFLGNVRSQTGDQATKKLFYEAYEPLAERELAQIADEAMKRYGLGNARIFHRMGEVIPGNSAVGVAVSAPHRAEAFEACSWIMDRIKKTAPIWKREHSPDGRVDWIHPGSPEGDSRQ